jgi:hypothetical protein
MMKAFRIAALIIASLCFPAAAQRDVASEDDLPQIMDAPPSADRPDGKDGDAASEPATPELPAAPPAPPPRAPDQPEMQSSGPAPIPAEEKACRARLSAMGVVFEEAAPISEPEGCSAPHPLTVSRLPGGVSLEPSAVLTCAMAEATALFVRDQAQPAIRAEFGTGLDSIRQVSSYVCRPRNGSSKLSEHAYANALDWGTLALDDGSSIDVRAHGRTEPRRTRLIETLRKAACGPFKTVLGPGSDADHADHFHFDMAERRNGGTFCQ